VALSFVKKIILWMPCKNGQIPENFMVSNRVNPRTFALSLTLILVFTLKNRQYRKRRSRLKLMITYLCLVPFVIEILYYNRFISLGTVLIVSTLKSVDLQSNNWETISLEFQCTHILFRCWLLESIYLYITGSSQQEGKLDAFVAEQTMNKYFLSLYWQI
jgi:hypothetical protein